MVAAQVFGPAPRNVLAEPEPPGTCYWGDPVVCFYQEHRRVADDVAVEILKLVRAADEAGYTALVPSRLEQRSRSYAPEGDTWGFSLPSGVLAGEPVDAVGLVATMLAPDHCTALQGDNEEPLPEVYMRTSTAMMATWLDLVGEGFMAPGDLELLAPDDAQRVMAAWEQCDLAVEP